MHGWPVPVPVPVPGPGPGSRSSVAGPASFALAANWATSRDTFYRLPASNIVTPMTCRSLRRTDGSRVFYPTFVAIFSSSCVLASPLASTSRHRVQLRVELQPRRERWFPVALTSRRPNTIQHPVGVYQNKTTLKPSLIKSCYWRSPKSCETIRIQSHYYGLLRFGSELMLDCVLSELRRHANHPDYKRRISDPADYLGVYFQDKMEQLGEMRRCYLGFKGKSPAINKINIYVPFAFATCFILNKIIVFFFFLTVTMVTLRVSFPINSYI